MNMTTVADRRFIKMLVLLFVVSSISVIIASPAMATEDPPEFIFPVVGAGLIKA